MGRLRRCGPVRMFAGTRPLSGFDLHMASPAATSGQETPPPSEPGGEPGMDAFLQRIFECSKDVTQIIARRASERRYAMRAAIVKQDDRPDAAFVLLVGRA